MLQVKSLQAGNCAKCPYCKADFAIYYNGANTAEQALQNRAEQERHAEAALKSKQVGVPFALLQLLRGCCPSPNIPDNHLLR